MNTEIDHYLERLPGPWPQELVEAVIAVFRDSGALDESIKWGHPYYSLHGRAVVKVFAARDWIDVFFYRGGELSDPDGLLGTEGRTSMRRLQIRRDDVVPGGLHELVRQAIVIAEANERRT